MLFCDGRQPGRFIRLAVLGADAQPLIKRKGLDRLLAAQPAQGDQMNNYKYWLIGCVAFVILEILPPPTHFFFVCMAFGALGASIAALFSSIVWLPWAVFAVVSVALPPLMIPLAKFLFTP